MPTKVDDNAIRETVFTLLDRRTSGATICPSEVARALMPDADGRTGAWRALMPRIREVAGRLAEQGRLRVTRGGVEVEATSGGGPIRLGQVGRNDVPPN